MKRGVTAGHNAGSDLDVPQAPTRNDASKRGLHAVNFRRAIAIVAVLMIVMTLAAGCGSKGQTTKEPDKIYIGWVAPLTGSVANDGQQMLNGAQLAIKEINDAGGINGKLIELVPQDDKSDPKEAANIATKFTADKRIIAVLGNYNSSCVLAGAPIYNKAQLPIVHVGTSPVITKEGGPYTYRISVTDAFQGKFVTGWLFEEGFKKPAILYENNDYGRGLLDVVSQEVATLGGTVAAKETYMLGETKDFTGIVTKVKASGADSVFIGGLYNEAALIAKQMKSLGVNLPIFGTDGLYERSLIELAGDAAEGIRVSGLLLATDPDPAIQTFVKNYEKAYGKLPGTYAAFHYDAAKLLAKAIAANGPTAEGIKKYLDTQEFTGVTGTLRFDGNHDATRQSMKKLIVKDGQFQVASK